MVACEFLRPRHRHGGDAGLGGGVIGLPYIPGARNAGNVDDHAAAAALDHVHGGLARAQEDASEVDGDDLVEFRHGHFPLNLAVRRLHQERIAGYAGIIDKAVDDAEVAVDASKQCLDSRLVGHVSWEAFDFASRTKPHSFLSFV